MEGTIEAALDTFRAVRPRLFGIAYRMLGSASEAEDIVQDAWLRWQGTDRTAVLDPPAFLATVTTRLSINALQSARARRETYIGPWLPEPVDTSNDPTLGAERAEALGFAVLVMLERLTPTERAAYVLREAFAYDYSQICEIVQVSEAAARQLVSRARKHLAGERRREVTRHEQHRLLTAFLAAAKTGDLEALEQLFTEDVVSYSDGGGVVRASKFPVVGRVRVARFVRAFHTHFWEGVDIEEADVNGQPSVILSKAGSTFAVVIVVASGDAIDQVLWMMNPHKLAAVALRAAA
ncbi:RNA polymerase sigma-70 factor (ECF subfamily) [Agromyces flavus]|uniref:RNA polymerase sigma-70 factor (ECF subfamily) n=1 Tax=Agromyces flavus TaxID=589382 RepID=A0A1H1W4N2_9MICO|nr:RNA polymerase sigma-70 factor [Agromyces flavus]MCP2366078.1 RNA polymerase sigma-70 factor (ECF subfamily) [Agromyces flavus]GGI43959.1 RNA polymerase sigma24 factor [Agromyces flavus]SDS91621.1 RNA polymerase sigma-70 factor, ECF subfamily [Agromyces flavus]